MLYLHKIYTRCFVTNYQFLPWYDWLLWYCLVLQLTIKWYPVSILMYPFLSAFQIFSSAVSLFCRLNYPYNSFLTLSVFLLVIMMQSLSVFLEFSNSCGCTILKAGDSSSFFISWHIVFLYNFSDLRPCASSSIFLTFGLFMWFPFLSILRRVQSIS